VATCSRCPLGEFPTCGTGWRNGRFRLNVRGRKPRTFWDECANAFQRRVNAMTSRWSIFSKRNQSCLWVER
jgi:hypothetical protein